MKRKLVFISILLILLLTTTSAVHAYRAGYSLPWWTVDAGGGNSNGIQYSLSGTIGQSDSGIMSGDGYTLAGGYYAGGWLLERQLFLPLITK